MDSSTAPFVSSVLTAVFSLLPLFLCVIFAMIFWKMQVGYKRRFFQSKQKMCVLEIRLPKEVTKSPLAMELLLSTLHMTGGDSGNFWDKFTSGKSRPTFSLEIASINGQVHFFIWTRVFFKKFVESQLYAQYPGIEVTEVPDYTEGITFDPSEMKVWGCDFELGKPDAFPLKTYVDYGLDKDPKEEFKVDPMTPMIEFMGSLRQGEQVWVQFIVRAHKKEGDTDAWKDSAKKEIETIRKKTLGDGVDKENKQPNPTQGQKDQINAIERNVSKLGYDCGVRAIYLADSDVFDPAHISGLMGVFKQYNSDMLNGFAPRRTTSFDYPWQDITGKKIIKKKKKKIQYYQWRHWFDSDDDEKACVLNTESLATVFHFPGNVSNTPTFARVLSKKAEPPANLPM